MTKSCLLQHSTSRPVSKMSSFYEFLNSGDKRSTSKMSSPPNPPPLPTSQPVSIYPVKESMFDKIGCVLFTLFSILGIFALVILSQECLPRLWPKMTGEFSGSVFNTTQPQISFLGQNTTNQHCDPALHTRGVQVLYSGRDLTSEEFKKEVVCNILEVVRSLPLVVLICSVLWIIFRVMCDEERKRREDKERLAAFDRCAARDGDTAVAEGKGVKEGLHSVEKDVEELGASHKESQGPCSESEIEQASLEPKVKLFNWEVV